RSYTSGRARATSASRRATVGSPAKRRRARRGRRRSPDTTRPSGGRRRGRETQPAGLLVRPTRRARATVPVVPPRTRRASDPLPSCCRCYVRRVASLDDRVTIATPEGVELELVLAGVGSRFAATLLDVVVQLGAIFALAIVLGPLGSNGYAVAVYLVAVFLIL